jgi:hypothetical protein
MRGIGIDGYRAGRALSFFSKERTCAKKEKISLFCGSNPGGAIGGRRESSKKGAKKERKTKYAPCKEA